VSAFKVRRQFDSARLLIDTSVTLLRRTG